MKLLGSACVAASLLFLNSPVQADGPVNQGASFQRIFLTSLMAHGIPGGELEELHKPVRVTFKKAAFVRNDRGRLVLLPSEYDVELQYVSIKKRGRGEVYDRKAITLKIDGEVKGAPGEKSRYILRREGRPNQTTTIAQTRIGERPAWVIIGISHHPGQRARMRKVEGEMVGGDLIGEKTVFKGQLRSHAADASMDKVPVQEPVTDLSRTLKFFLTADLPDGWEVKKVVIAENGMSYVFSNRGWRLTADAYDVVLTRGGVDYKVSFHSQTASFTGSADEGTITVLTEKPKIAVARRGEQAERNEPKKWVFHWDRPDGAREVRSVEPPEGLQVAAPAAEECAEEVDGGPEAAAGGGKFRAPDLKNN